MKPTEHAKLMKRIFGGKKKDYSKINEWFDTFRIALPDPRHRIFLHNSVGIILCEQVFGKTITNSDKKVISVRELAELHIIQDLGFIPTPGEAIELLNNKEKLKPHLSETEKKLKKEKITWDEMIRKLRKKVKDPDGISKGPYVNPVKKRAMDEHSKIEILD